LSFGVGFLQKKWAVVWARVFAFLLGLLRVVLEKWCEAGGFCGEKRGGVCGECGEFSCCFSGLKNRTGF
jgi:hypothetical protein